MNMTKNTLIEMAERFKTLGLNSKDASERSLMFDMASQYYKEADQYNLMIWCRNKKDE
jgi:hypothetical protein